MTSLRILMVGAGAVGGYFGAQLVAADRDVTFLVRDARATVLRRDGLRIYAPEGDFTVAPTVITRDELHARRDEGTHNDPRESYDLVIVTVKAFGLDAAIDDFAPAVGPQTRVLPLLNGMRHLDVLRERFGSDRVLGGCCVVAAQQEEDGSIRRLYGDASVTYGGLADNTADAERLADSDDAERLANTADSERLADIDAALSGAGFATRLSSAVELDMWEKWPLLASAGAANCLMRGTIGEIVAVSGGEETVRSIIGETRAVATAAGFEPRVKAVDRTETMLTQQGSAFTTSMYRDMLQGFSVEADHILGDLVDRAHRLEVPVPLLTAASATLAVYSAR